MSDLSALPTNRTPFERAFESVIAKHTNITPRIGDLWNPETCPEPALKYLAWALNVDQWDDALPEPIRRKVLRASVNVHAVKGTLNSVYSVLEAFGYSDAEIIDWPTAARLDDGNVLDDGHRLHTLKHWADYEILIGGGINAAAAARLAKILISSAPGHCRLVRIAASVVVALDDGHSLDGETALDATYLFED